MNIEVRDKNAVAIAKWENLTNEIVENWIYEYFEIEDSEEISFDWASVGGVFSFADYWISFENVLECYKLDVKKEDFFLWYDSCLENQSFTLSLSNFILSPKERKAQQKRSLEESKQRLELAEKEFKKSLERYENNRT